MSLLSSIFRTSLLRDSLKLASSNLLMFLLPLVVTPILSRMYLPEDFGDWGVFSSTYTILNFVLFLCFEHTIIKVRPKDFANAIALCCLTSLLIITLSFFVYFTGSALSIQFFTNFPCITFFFGYLIITAISTIFQNISNRLEMYWVMSLYFFITGIGQALLRITFGVEHIYKNGLIAGTVLAHVLSCLFIVTFVLRHYRTDSLSLKPSLKGIQNVAYENRKFPLYDAPATLLSFSAFNLPLIILSYYFAKAEIGCYSIIIHILLLPISLIGSAIGKVYFQRLTNNNTPTDNVTKISLEILRITTLLAIIPALFLLLGGDHIVVIFLGNRWATVGSIAICLSIWSIPTVLTQPMLPAFRAFNHQNKLLKYNSLDFIFGIGSIFAGCIAGWNLYLTLSIYVLSCVIVKFMMLGELLHSVGVSWSQAFKWHLRLIYILTFALWIAKIVSII